MSLGRLLAEGEVGGEGNLGLLMLLGVVVLDAGVGFNGVWSGGVTTLGGGLMASGGVVERGGSLGPVGVEDDLVGVATRDDEFEEGV